MALAAASEVADRFADGVVLVELAAVTPAALSVSSSLMDAVQAALDVREIAGPADTVVERLAAVMGSRLLVLDNCEQVVAEVAELTDRLLAAAPGLRVLATSREPLGLAGEVVWTVPPLDVPSRDARPDAVGQSSAVQLFVARASAASRGFTLSATKRPPTCLCCADGLTGSHSRWSSPRPEYARSESVAWLHDSMTASACWRPDTVVLHRASRLCSR